MAASIDIILYYAFPHKAFHSCPATILAKLYSNSMLAIFNSRIRIVGGRNDINGVDSYSSIAPKRRSTSGPHATSAPHGSGLHWVRSPRSANGTPPFGGVHIHEQRWISTDAEAIELQDQSEFLSKKSPSFGPEV